MSDSSPISASAPPDVCTFALMVGGASLSGQFHVLSIAVDKELNRIASASIELRDGDPALATFEASNAEHFIPGKEIDIQLGYGGTNQSVFKGIVVKHSIRVRKDHSVLLVECRDKAVRMTAEARSRHFLDQKDSDIIADIIGGHGLAHDVAASAAKLEEVVQFGATDWDFVLCRAEANGLVVLADAGKVSVLRPDLGQQPVVTVKYGSTLLELDAEIDARWQSKGVKATSWNAADQALVEAEGSEPSGTGGGNLAPADLAAVVGGDAQVLRHGGALAQPELQAWADARLLKGRLAKLRGRARCQGFAAAKPGAIVELKGIGQRFEGKLYVSGVRHTVANGNWETDLQFGLNPQLFAERFNLRPMPAGGLLPAVSGLQVGVVSALGGDPAGEDRIAVRLPLLGDAGDGLWARIATLDAGKDRGTFFRPEIGDEVVVGFLDSDPRHPVVLGMCHSSAKPAPEPPSDDNHHKGYASREKLRMLFDDEKKVILFETPGGNKLTLSEGAKGILLEDQNGNKITLDDKGISIESSKDLVLKASGDIKLEGVNIDVKAQAGLKAKGGASVELSGASTAIKGSATVEIKGGMVLIN
jgi:Rhs element Vgr protein